jgi:type VI secretion system secreted protein Hcp
MALVDYFLKVEGIDGEATADKHTGELDVESWSWGESQTGTHGAGGGGGAGKVAMQDVHFVCRMSKASPKLFLACATGEHIKKVSLTCRKAGKEQHEYLKMHLSDCLISSYQTGGSGRSETLPVDQFSVNFSKIEWEYKEQKPDGTLGGAVTAGFDVKTGKKV